MANWNLDTTHSYASFAVRHMMVTTVRGKFENVTGTVEFDPENPAAASVYAEIDATSINTGVNDRDNHLRSADFLDAENFPKLIFQSTGIEVTGDKVGKITGDLTIRGTTRPVTLNVEFFGEGTTPYGTQVAGFHATTKINREDFGLTWNQALEAGGVLVGKEVNIDLDVEIIKEAVSQPA